MNDLPAFTADAWVSLCAAIATLIVLNCLSKLVPQKALGRRYKFCLWLLFVLMIARIGHWGDWGWFFFAATNASAALVPLAALLLSEAILRRHAPKALKYVCAGGAVLFSLIGIFSIEVVDFWRIAGLLVFQVITISAIAIFVIRRDRASLSPIENQIIDRVSLSFLVILPFLISDFMRNPLIDLPVRMGGIAVLALCWLSIGLNRSGLKKAQVCLNYAVVLAMTFMVTWLTSVFVPLDPRMGVQLAVVILAAMMVLIVWQAAIALHIEDRQQVALREIAQAHGEGEEAALGLFRRATEAPQAVLILETDLYDVDIDTLRTCFKEQAVHQIGDIEDEQLAWLFARFDATHATAASITPLRLIMSNTPDLVTTDGSTDTIGAIQRVVFSMIERSSA